MAENNNHYKTRQAVAQALGNTGAQQLPGVVRSAADEGLKRMAAHEKATRRLAALRRTAVADHNAAVAQMNQKLANIEKGYRPGLTGATRRVEAARGALERYHANVEEMGRRVARGNTNRAVREATGRINQLRGNVRRGVDLIKSNRKLRAAMGGSTVFENQTLAEVKGAAAQAKQAVQQRTELIRARAAGGEAKDASAFMNRTLKSQRAQGLRADVFNAEQQLRQVNQAAQNSRRAAISRARDLTQQVQQRFNAAATKVVSEAGPKATFFQRAAAKMSQLGHPVTPPATASTTGKGIGLFASRAEIAGRVAELANTSPKTAKMVRGLGRAGEWMVKKGGTIVRNAGGLRLPSRVIAGTLGKIEAAGKLVAGTGKAGKIISGVTNATGLAGGFALGAWIDAGLNYAEAHQAAKEMGYKGVKDMFSALGETNYTETVRDKNGVEHVVDYRNPTLADVVTSKEYWGGVVRGTLRNLTFGIFGQDKYGWEQDGRTPEQQIKDWNQNWLRGRDPLTGEVARDRNGEDVSHILFDQRKNAQAQVNRAQGIAAYFMSFDPANKDKAKSVGDARVGMAALGFRPDAQTDAVGFITAVKHLGELKDQKLEGIRQRIAAGDHAYDDEISRYMGAYKVDREKAVSMLMDRITERQTKEYEKRLGLMMKSDAATKASDYNRRAAYLTITGRDYDVDTSAKLDTDAKQTYADFNNAWAAMDVKDRVLFDREEFAKDEPASEEVANG